MKKYSLFQFLFLTLFLSTATFLNAQTKYTKTLNCGEKHAIYDSTFVSEICFKKSIFKTIENAKDTLESDLKAHLTCDNSGCPDKKKYDCEAVLKEFLHGTGTLVENAAKTHWCTRGKKIVFSWKCTPCERDTAVVIIIEEEEEVPLPDGETTEDTEGLDHAHDHQPSSQTLKKDQQNSLGYIERIAPNPSSDLFHINLVLRQNDSPVEVRVSDLNGKLLLQDHHINGQQSNLTLSTDLSDFQSGLYLLSVLVDGQLIGTEKISIYR